MVGSLEAIYAIGRMRQARLVGRETGGQTIKDTSLSGRNNNNNNTAESERCWRMGHSVRYSWNTKRGALPPSAAHIIILPRPSNAVDDSDLLLSGEQNLQRCYNHGRRRMMDPSYHSNFPVQINQKTATQRGNSGGKRRQRAERIWSLPVHVATQSSTTSRTRGPDLIRHSKLAPSTHRTAAWRKSRPRE